MLVSAYNCGIIAAFREIYRSESVVQTTNFLNDIPKNSKRLTNIIIYDRGCDMKRMVKKTFPADHVLSSMDNVIDKFHFFNHTEAYCKENCNPNERELEGVNTEVCEQINFWISRFKHIVKHMNCDRYYYFIYIIFNHYNEMKMKKDKRHIKRGLK